MFAIVSLAVCEWLFYISVMMCLLIVNVSCFQGGPPPLGCSRCWELLRACHIDVHMCVHHLRVHMYVPQRAHLRALPQRAHLRAVYIYIYIKWDSFTVKIFIYFHASLIIILILLIYLCIQQPFIHYLLISQSSVSRHFTKFDLFHSISPFAICF